MRLIMSPVGKHLWRILLLGLVVLVLTMAVYSREPFGWRNEIEGYRIDVTRAVLGLPQWLTVTCHEVEGSPPPLDSAWLPFEPEKWLPGWHVRRMRLLASVLGSVVISAAVYALGVAFSRGRSRVNRSQLVSAYAAVVVPALAIGAVVPTDPEWVGVTLGLVFFPACLVLAASVVRSYWHGACLGFIAFYVLWWSQRMTDLFRDTHFVIDLPNADDLIPLVVFVPIFTLVGILATLVAKFVVHQRTVA